MVFLDGTHFKTRWIADYIMSSGKQASTNRWPGRPAASQIAAPSTASFVLRRT